MKLDEFNKSHLLAILSAIDDPEAWLKKKKISQYTIRSEKSNELLQVSHKAIIELVKKGSAETSFLNEVFRQLQGNKSLCEQFCHILRHVSSWDHEYEYLYDLACEEPISNPRFYLLVRETTLNSHLNKGGRENMFGVVAPLDNWIQIALQVFPSIQRPQLIASYNTVIRDHYLHIKKSKAASSFSINGAQNWRICQLIDMAQQAETLDMGLNISTGRNAVEHELASLISLKAMHSSDKDLSRIIEEQQQKINLALFQELNQLRASIQQERATIEAAVSLKEQAIQDTLVIVNAAESMLNEGSRNSRQALLGKIEWYSNKRSVSIGELTRLKGHLSEEELIDIICLEQAEEDE